jgi:hypothetical protein
MVRNRWIPFVSVCLFALVAGAWMNAAAQAPAGTEKPAAHKVVGATQCKMCHQGPAKGDQFKIWSESAHAKAYTDLATPAALEVAKKAGVADPQKDEKCLGCHTTAHYTKADCNPSYKVDEGVGCEACHGPGSDYKAMAVMKDKAAAMKAGMTMPDEAFCKKCHNENSPTFKAFNYAEFWKKIAHPMPKAAG